MSKADRPDHPRSSERFNEDQATYAVRGSEQPDLEQGVAAIREVLRTLPRNPGVYRMQDARGDVLYVGKARQQAVVLGCTELVMIVDPGANVLPIYDTTALHAGAAVEWILSGNN